MNRTAFWVPPQTVHNVLQQLKLQTQLQMKNTCLGDSSSSQTCWNSIMGYLQLHPLPDQALLPKHHRIQISIRGQRFEMSQSIATNYFIALFLFFWLPMERERPCDPARLPTHSSDRVGTSSGVKDAMPEMCSWVAKLLCQNEDDPLSLSCSDPAQLTSVLTQHYRRTVWPCLVSIVEMLEMLSSKGKHQHIREGEKHYDCDGVAQNTMSQLAELSLSIPMVELVSWDASTQQWRFVFHRRLDDDTSLMPLGCSKDKVEIGGSSVMLERNGNPLLLLQPHYMGAILVYLRRLEQLTRSEMDDCKKKKMPLLGIRWKELNYDEQLCVSKVVRALGIVPLIREFGAPIANMATSQYLFNNLQPPMDHPCKKNANSPTERTPAPQQIIPTSSQTECEEDSIQQGCVKCGIYGHSVLQCPYSFASE